RLMLGKAADAGRLTADARNGNETIITTLTAPRRLSSAPPRGSGAKKRQTSDVQRQTYKRTIHAQSHPMRTPRRARRTRGNHRRASLRPAQEEPPAGGFPLRPGTGVSAGAGRGAAGWAAATHRQWRGGGNRRQP